MNDNASALDPYVAPLDYPMFVVSAASPTTGERGGCLVGFATQCSICPPRVLVCLSRANHTYRVAAAAPVLAVHLLGADQHELAALFGTRTGDDVDKFTRCRWHPGPAGVPLLDDCPHRFVGTVLARVDLGDHEGFLLAPTDVGTWTAGRPLMFTGVRDLEAGHPA